MRAIDLSIVSRGTAGSDWSAEKGKIDQARLSEIAEDRADNFGALNALPTPFARFFVVKEAFRRLLEQKRNASSQAGQVYEWLVSDCLDVFELLFNKRYHDMRNERIVIKEWNKQEGLRNLRAKMPILEKALQTYYDSDLGEQTTLLYFIILESAGKRYLLGISSPMTGFITPPDLDKISTGREWHFAGERYATMPNLRRKENKGLYFKESRPFEARSVEFKNYMYQLFSRGTNVNMEYLRDYIKAFDNDPDIRNDYQLKLTPCQSIENENVIINGLPIRYNDEVGDYFTDTIIKLPYRIAEENYIVYPFDGNAERTSDFLLPISEEALTRLDVNHLDVRYKLGYNKVTVTLTIQGKEYSKDYVDTPCKPEEGTILDLSMSKIYIDMGLFPNIKASNEELNNYYKLMWVAADQNARRTFDISHLNCTFYRQNKDGYSALVEAQDNTFTSGVRPSVVRSSQQNVEEFSTKYYELFGTSFDFIRLSLRLNGKDYYGLIQPKWFKSDVSKKSFIYAIDFGTSNTFVSRREIKAELQEPEQLKMDRPIMSYLHRKSPVEQKEEINRWEEGMQPVSMEYFFSEFIPPYIDGKRYRFPLRTALSNSQRMAKKLSLFDNCNIAFSYGKKKVLGNNKVETNFKWNEEKQEYIESYIRELLMLIKYDMLQEQVDINQTKIVWFRPLSFRGSLKEIFEDIWKNASSEILGIPSSQVLCLSESEAPYYYYSKKGSFKAIESVALIDIGGGSTDIVCFNNNKPRFANSVHFGCDVLWGNGYNQFVGAKDNGIFQKLQDIIKFENADLAQLNEYMKSTDSGSSTKDIINLWIDNANESRVVSLLKQHFRPVFLYHYASIIYYLAKMIKSKGERCPQTILFSGNGSKYIDGFLHSEHHVLELLANVILDKEFPEHGNLTIILPNDRKESTCYGGLFRDESAQRAETYYFMGVDNTQYKDVKELKQAFENGLREQITDEVFELNKYYLTMLDVLIREEELKNINKESIEHAINEDIADAVHTAFQKEVIDKNSDSVSYGDTLFFLPIVDQILKLTKI